MTTKIDFDQAVFTRMTWEQWRQRYSGVIRVSCHLEPLPDRRVRLLLCNPGQVLYIPHYDANRSWRNGSPKSVRVGDKAMLVRCCAVKYRGRFLVLDGVHRLADGPRFVVLDYLELDDYTWRRFTDLYSQFFHQNRLWATIKALWSRGR